MGGGSNYQMICLDGQAMQKQKKRSATRMIFNIIFTGDKMKFESYEICSTGIKSICKSPSAWGRREGTNSNFPLVHFAKPRWMKADSFKELVKNIHITIKKDQEFEEK